MMMVVVVMMMMMMINHLQFYIAVGLQPLIH